VTNTTAGQSQYPHPVVGRPAGRPAERSAVTPLRWDESGELQRLRDQATYYYCSVSVSSSWSHFLAGQLPPSLKQCAELSNIPMCTLGQNDLPSSIVLRDEWRRVNRHVNGASFGRRPVSHVTRHRRSCYVSYAVFTAKIKLKLK